jgi:hypothetical protein
MGHEDYGFGAMVDGVFDGGEGADDALVVCDVFFGVEGNVEVDPYQDAFAFEIDIAN